MESALYRPGIRVRVVVAALFAALTLPAVGVGTVRGATFQVNTADSGIGSLRDAITQANLSAGSTITFNIGGGGARTIGITSGLPPITVNMTIDGTTQPGYAGAPLVTLDGGNAVLTALDGEGGQPCHHHRLVLRTRRDRRLRWSPGPERRHRQ